MFHSSRRNHLSSPFSKHNPPAVSPLGLLGYNFSMTNREAFAVGEYYHIYNRGVDKRSIISDRYDSARFVDSLKFFNSIEPIRSLRDLDALDKEDISNDVSNRLVKIVAYCLNLNHYHLIIGEINDGGISEFMKRIGGGYTWYFNNKHGRSGALFQGVFKSVRVETNEQLLHLSAYVNLNDKVHSPSGFTAGGDRAVKSSWNEYLNPDDPDGFCSREIITDQFRGPKQYQKFAYSSLKEIVKLKIDKKNQREFIIGKYLFP